MIRTSVLRTRATRGYSWLATTGHHYGLDVQRLHRFAYRLSVRHGFACPLALSLPSGRGFHTARLMLEDGVKFSGAPVYVRRIYDFPQFAYDHGFSIDTDGLLGWWGINPGTHRDWSVLDDCWREVIAANEPAEIPQLVGQR